MNHFLKIHFALICILVFILFSILCISPEKAKADEIIVPKIIVLKINPQEGTGNYFNSFLGQSRLTLNTYKKYSNSSIPSDDFVINGAIYTNSQDEIVVSVNPTFVTLLSGYTDLKVQLKGNIGNAPLSDVGQLTSLSLTNLIQNLPWQANIQIIGDVDESTISAMSRAGIYGGSFTITATLL